MVEWKLDSCDVFESGAQTRNLGMLQNARLLTELEQVRIAGQQFAWSPGREAIVQRIHKVQRCILCVQFERSFFLHKTTNLWKRV